MLGLSIWVAAVLWILSNDLTWLIVLAGLIIYWIYNSGKPT